MKSKILWAMTALNVLLLITFIGQLAKPNYALGQAGRRPDYIMIPGHVAGAGAGSVVYIIDTANRQLSARALDRNTFDDMPQPIDLTRVLSEPTSGGRTNDRGR